MLFPMSETFKKSQMSEFFDVSAGCVRMKRYMRIFTCVLYIKNNLKMCCYVADDYSLGCLLSD